MAVLAALIWAAPAHAAGVVAWAGRDCSLYALTSVPDPCPRAIFVAREDGSGITRLTDAAEPGVPTAGGDVAPSFSPDGRRIAFSRATRFEHLRDRFGVPLEGAALWTMAADGSDQRRVMSSGDLDRLPLQERPLWTDGGRRLVFEGGSPGDAAVYTVAADGTDLRRITPVGEIPRFVSVTPDGDVAYTTAEFYRPGSQAAYGTETTIWRADPHTGERARIFFGDTAAVFGRVSRDGRWMALNTERAGVYGIQTLAMDGSGLVWRARDSGDVRFSSVVWADGGRMLFLQEQGDYADPATLSWDLMELDVDRDSGPRRVLKSVPFRLYDWHAGAVEAPEPRDDLPPVVMTEAAAKPALASAARVRRFARVPLIAADGTGIARIEVSFARVVRKGRCRFATTAGRLGPASACNRPRWRAIDGVAAWRRMTDPLPRGRYELRVRARDTEGNRSRGAKVRRLNLRSAPR
jgi:Tol biopolymer transport system component